MNFETEVAKVYNLYFKENNIDALAYRFEKSNRFTTQPCDVLVDSRDQKFYLAIECKSMKVDGQRPLYFSSNFSNKGLKHQIDRMEDFCTITGRHGVLAVELYNKPRSRDAFLVPFHEVFVLWKYGKSGLPLKTIRHGTHLGWCGTYSKGYYSF